MSKHTPGPWRIKQPGEHSATNIRITDNALQRINIGIAEICIQRQLGAKKPSPVEQANARLIAAAPDLLDSCTRIAAYVELMFPGEVDEDVWTELRAAIAKATRAQPSSR